MSVSAVIVAAGKGQNSSGSGVAPRLYFLPRCLGFPPIVVVVVVGWFTGEQGAFLDRIRPGLGMISTGSEEGRVMV